jgi:hypothetical protein
MSAPRAHVALLVDFANIRQQIQPVGASAASGEASSESGASVSSAELARSLVQFASGVGRVGVARAYADWSREPKVARELNGTSLAPILVPATEDGEDRSHIRLVVDAMEALYNGDEPDAFVIASSDPSLVPLVQAIRAHGSEVIVVAADEEAADEMLAESDQFARLDDVLEGLVGKPVLPRDFGERERGRNKNKAAKAKRAEDRSPRERGYYSSTPLLTEPDFHDYDWGGFVQLIDELEQRLPFVGVRYLVNKVLGPHNCGVDDPHIKRDLINEAVDEGMIEMYTVGNVNERTDPVTACRLDRENPVVQRALELDEAGESQDAEEAGFADGAPAAEGEQTVDAQPVLFIEDAPEAYSPSAP